MQSEAESWSEPIVDCSEAAHPAICVSRIKREIPDMAEYMGKQPEFVECVDFTPLIDPVSDVNFNDFNPVRPVNGRGRNGNRRQTDLNDLENAPSTKRKPPLIMQRFVEPTTSNDTEEVERAQTENERQWEFDVGSESGESLFNDEPLAKNDSIDAPKTKLTTDFKAKSFVCSTNPSTSSSSEDSGQDLMIYIPKFKKKRKSKNVRNLIVRTFGSQFLEKEDVELQKYCAYCGAKKPSEVIAKCEEARLSGVRPRLVDYSSSSEDDFVQQRKCRFVKEKQPKSLIKKRIGKLLKKKRRKVIVTSF